MENPTQDEGRQGMKVSWVMIIFLPVFYLFNLSSQKNGFIEHIKHIEHILQFHLTWATR